MECHLASREISCLEDEPTPTPQTIGSATANLHWYWALCCFDSVTFTSFYIISTTIFESLYFKHIYKLVIFLIQSNCTMKLNNEVREHAQKTYQLSIHPRAFQLLSTFSCPRNLAFLATKNKNLFDFSRSSITTGGFFLKPTRELRRETPAALFSGNLIPAPSICKNMKSSDSFSRVITRVDISLPW